MTCFVVGVSCRWPCLHIHTHAEAPELTVAHGNQQEPEYQRLQRLESSVSVRQPLLKLNEKTLYDVVIVRYQEPSEPQRSEQVKPKQQEAGSSRPTAIHSSPRALPKLSHHMVHVEIDKEIENTQSLLSCPLAEAATNNTLLEVQPLVRLNSFGDMRRQAGKQVNGVIMECRDRAR
jgi:hypothetical protein